MKKHIGKIIAGLCIAAVLAFAFLWGGNTPEIQHGNTAEVHKEEALFKSDEIPKELKMMEEPEKKEEKSSTAEKEERQEARKEALKEELPKPEKKESEKPVENGEKDKSDIKKNDVKEEHFTEPVPDEQKASEIVQETAEPGGKHTCTLSVSCDTILKNIGYLNPEKTGLVPEDGVIFKKKTVEFFEGESVFDVLLREMKNSKIHLEFVNTPIYNSVYIEGINNLYEFDCGELSGWVYRVNGSFPNYGCSLYKLNDGDCVEWLYTCDLGSDVGGNNTEG